MSVIYNLSIMVTNLHIAIDGPAASGKTATGKKLAIELNINYIDTGMMYRAITYYFHNLVKEYADIKVVENFNFDKNIKIKIDNQNNLLLNNDDISKYLYSDEVTNNVSFYSRIESVRNFLVNEQRLIAQNKDIIMIGRDIGTVVLPSAKYKFFLDCNLESRAERRMKQEKNLRINEENLYKNIDQIKNRDSIDKSRELSPMKPSDDAIIIYNDHIDLNETTNLMKNIVLE
jgi:cytidylate kinase